MSGVRKCVKPMECHQPDEIERNLFGTPGYFHPFDTLMLTVAQRIKLFSFVDVMA